MPHITKKIKCKYLILFTFYLLSFHNLLIIFEEITKQIFEFTDKIRLKDVKGFVIKNKLFK